MKDIQLRQLFRNTENYADQEVIIRGWIRTNRSSNKFGFVEINDGSFFKSVQVVYEEEIIANFEEISKAPIAAALMVKGKLLMTPGAKQPFEIKALEVVVEMLLQSEKEFQFPGKWGIDLQTEHERYITEEIFKKPVFVTDYPKDIKAFYMRMNDDNKTVAAMDLLVPGVGEIIGGSQREERIDLLKGRMAEMGLDEKEYWWYLDIRKYGGVKHAGYGLGFERIIMYITGMSNIRDVQPFPRTPKTAEF